MFQFIRELWFGVRPYRVRLLLGVFAGIGCGLVEPLLMAAVKIVVNGLFPTVGADTAITIPAWAPTWMHTWAAQISEGIQSAKQHPQAILLLIASIPAVMLVRGILGYLNVYFLQWAACRAIMDLRVKLFAHLFTQPLSFFHRTSTGELMSRLTSDISALQGVISNMTAVIIKDPVTLASLLVFLLWQNPRLTLAVLVVIPVCVVPISIYGRKARRTAATIQEELVEGYKILHESFTGARIIKAYNLEATVVDQYAKSSAKYVSLFTRLIRSTEIPGPLIEFFGSVGVAIFLLYIALTSQMKATPGDFLQVIGSIFLMYKPIKSLTRLHNQLLQARAASERVFQLLALKSDLREPTNPLPLRAAGADVRFEQVSFAYGEKPILRAVNFTVRAGQLVALVGSSGSGKTTLTNLLLRFYDPQSGVIRIGGVDIRDVATRDLREQIAVVTQETILFNDTIRNNLRMGRPTATDAEIEAAAKHAHAHEFILEKPESYDTVIGEKGVTLSGGQRQRLAIARAILKNAPILVLDEATSALDTESERAVQAALDSMMQGRTTICIAHRLSTIQHADVILVFAEGQIVETGTHAELLAQQGTYHKLHQLQFRA